MKRLTPLLQTAASRSVLGDACGGEAGGRFRRTFVARAADAAARGGDPAERGGAARRGNSLNRGISGEKGGDRGTTTPASEP